jgi:hypothetical protein
MLEEDKVIVNMPNDYGLFFDVETVKKWVPKKINVIGEDVFFFCDDLCLSMKTLEFNRIFNYDARI